MAFQKLIPIQALEHFPCPIFLLVVHQAYLKGGSEIGLHHHFYKMCNQYGNEDAHEVKQLVCICP